MSGRESTPLGVIGLTVAANVERLRKQSGWTFKDLSDRLDKVGRPIPPLGLRRLRDGERRVDVDELFALCDVFGISLEVMTDRAAAERYRTDCLRWLLAEAERM